MPIKWAQTEQEKIEIALWVGGQGDATPLVRAAITRTGLTLGAALITREASDGFRWN